MPLPPHEEVLHVRANSGHEPNGIFAASGLTKGHSRVYICMTEIDGYKGLYMSICVCLYNWLHIRHLTTRRARDGESVGACCKILDFTYIDTGSVAYDPMYGLQPTFVKSATTLRRGYLQWPSARAFSL
jgi:hypothetical protein